MSDKRRRIDFVLVLAILIVSLYVIYWIGNEFYLYRNFISIHPDLGYLVQTTYVHLSHPALIYGLQYLVFSNHVSIFSVFLLPIFALVPNPITLIAIQDVFLGLTALLLYLCGRDMVDSRLFGFMLVIAFLFNPGVRGMIAFDFHTEAFIPFFFVLSFYLYMKNKMNYFVASFALMLSTIEVSWPAGVALVMGLLYYEFRYKSKSKVKEEQSLHKKRVKYLLGCIAVIFLFVLFYNYTISTLTSQYKQGLYGDMPPPLQVTNYYSIDIWNSASLALIAISNTATVRFVSLIGILLLLFGFGFTSLVDPILTITMILPWIIQVPILHNAPFGVFDNQYYGFTVGGSAITSVLGMKILLNRKNGFFARHKDKFILFTTVFVIISSFLIYLATFPASLPITPLITSNSNYPNYTQISTALDKIPQNATVMTQPNILPHLYYVLEIEFVPGFRGITFAPYNRIAYTNISFYWFRPDYIVIQPQSGWFDYMFNSSSFNVYKYMGDNYTLYSNTSGLEIYKLKSYQNLSVS